MKKTGEVSLTTLEAALESLGVKQDTGRIINPLNEAARLRATGHFTEAETRLKALLAKNPADTDAALMLMRLYAHDFHQPDQAVAVLQALEKQPHIEAAHLEYARKTINEWTKAGLAKTKPAQSTPPPAPMTWEEMLAQGFFGSAIELLEEQFREQPLNFEVRLRLASIHAVYCANLPRAEKLVRQIEADKNFTPEQAAAARTKLKEWQESRLQRK